jgi:hypothetical protein
MEDKGSAFLAERKSEAEVRNIYREIILDETKCRYMRARYQCGDDHNKAMEKAFVLGRTGKKGKSAL